MSNVRLASSTAGDALEPEGRAAGLPPLDLGLDVDVREDAVGQGVLEAEGDEQVLQGLLDRRDRLGRARHRVVAEDHVADGERPAGEDLPADVVDVVGRRVRLNPGAEVSLRADPAAGERVEDLRAEGDQLLVAHQLDDGADGEAGEAGHDRLDGVLVAVEQEAPEVADRHPGRLGTAPASRSSRSRSASVSSISGWASRSRSGRVAQEGPGVSSRVLVGGGDADDRVALLEGVGGAEELLVERLVERGRPRPVARWTSPSPSRGGATITPGLSVEAAAIDGRSGR